MPSAPIGRILAPIDYSATSAAVLDAARELGRGLGAAVDILQVLDREELGGHSFAAPSPPEPGPTPGRERLRNLLATGPVAETILRLAQGYDLVVIGLNASTTLSWLSPDNVTARVLREASCPVLTVRGPRRERTAATRASSRPRLVTLRDGTTALLRPITPADRQALQQGLQELSETSRYRRFLSPLATLSEAKLRYLTEIDYLDHMAWGLGDPASGAGWGIGRYVRLADEPTVAEPAIAVIDARQRRGIGTLLLDALCRSAAANGIDTFRSFVLEENTPVLTLLRNLGADPQPAEPGVLRVDLPVVGTSRELAGSLTGRFFDAVAKQDITRLLARFFD